MDKAKVNEQEWTNTAKQGKKHNRWSKAPLRKRVKVEGIHNPSYMTRSQSSSMRMSSLDQVGAKGKVEDASIGTLRLKVDDCFAVFKSGGDVRE